MTDRNSVYHKITRLLNSQRFAVLATQGREYPYCTLVGYSVSPDYSEIIFATDRQTHKFRNLKRMPRVSVLIDNQTNRANDINEAQALTALGGAYEISSLDESRYRVIHLKRHPNLHAFLTVPGSALIRIKVEKYLLVQHFQEVLEFTPS